MIEQRLQLSLRRILLVPVALFLVLTVWTVSTAQQSGVHPRETLYDLYARISPRPAAEPTVAIIDIDAESLERVGPWPWPRTTIAALVRAAGATGAASITVTVPSEGQDPLSPELVSRFWTADRAAEPILRAVRQLPTNDSALALAAREACAVSLGVGASPAAPSGWTRADLAGSAWLGSLAATPPETVALPAAPVFAALEPVLEETSLVAVAALPLDADAVFRRLPLIWSIEDRPAPAVALAPFVLTDQAARIGTSSARLGAAGSPPTSLALGDRRIALDSRAGIRIWLPQDMTLPRVPAWRVLDGGTAWGGPLRGRHVLIGETVSPNSQLVTARGRVNVVDLHAQAAQQLGDGLAHVRPGWAMPAELFLAFLFAVAGVAGCMFLRPPLVVLISSLLAGISVLGAYLGFSRGGILLDATPLVIAALGVPAGILITLVTDMLVRDDNLRGAFHGALPPKVMERLHARGGARMLRGVRQQVTVLSCGLKLPPAMMDRFDGRPDDFVRFLATANDALRRTILAHEGTVDYGEDGRLLGYWNVPEVNPTPIEKACACALKMIDDVNAMSEKIQTSAYAEHVTDATVDIGFADSSIEIGLASAICFAGPVGLEPRNRYSVIGDAVRLASALRQRARRYGPAIITDDVVFDALRHHYAFLDLDVIRTRDDEPMRVIYGLVGNPFLKASKSFRQLSDIQRELVLAWRQGDLAATTLQLQRLRGVPGIPDSYIEEFETRLQRARAMEDNPPDAAELLQL